MLTVAAAAALSSRFRSPHPLPRSPPPAASAAHPLRLRHGSSCASDRRRGRAGLHIVKSPIVGTFYEAPSPGAPPFVKLGDTLPLGQVLCIVEAMKLMNEIESDVAGEVVKILVSQRAAGRVRPAAVRDPDAK